METIKKQIVRLVKDEQGGEMLEYALIAGLIVVAAIAVIGLVGTQVKGTWDKINTEFSAANPGSGS